MQMKTATNKKSSRLGWVDLAKVVSICLVSSFHTAPALTGYSASLVQMLRMPAFFLIAGLLFDERKFPTLLSLLKHRARQLLVPYLCFECILIPITCSSGAEMADAARNALLGHPTTCFPLWFLVCLFGTQIVHYLGIRLTACLTHDDWSRHRFWLLGAYVTFAVLTAHVPWPQHGQINAIVTNLPFYAAANCAKDVVHAVRWRDWPTTGACLVLGLVLVGVKSEWMTAGTGWLSDSAFYFVHVLTGLLLLPPYIATCKVVGSAIGNAKLIEYLGSNTIVILALHTYLIKVFTIVIGMDNLMGHAWLNPIVTIVIVLMHYPLIWIINQWMPWMLGRRR